MVPYGADELLRLAAFSCVAVVVSLLANSRHRALEESEQRFASMADGAPVVIWVTDAEGGNRFVNRAFTEFFGVPLEQVEGRKWQPLIHPDDAGRYVAEFQRAVLLRTAFRSDARMRRADGEWRWMSSYAEPCFSAAGDFVGHNGISLDVTDRRQAEDAQSRLAAIVESSDDAILSEDLAGTIQTWNAGAQRLFGYSATEIVGQSVTMLVPPERVNELQQILDRLCTGQLVEHLETVRVTKDSRRLDVSVTVSPLKDAAGRVVGACKIVRDITERTRTENAVRESEERFRALFEHSPDAVFLTTTDGRITAANPAACAVFQMTEEDICGAGGRD